MKKFTIGIGWLLMLIGVAYPCLTLVLMIDLWRFNVGVNIWLLIASIVVFIMGASAKDWAIVKMKKEQEG